MKFLQNMKKKKANNKGFSLVELIIVIAIMAILVGVVGSQVVPYLEKSRKSKDIQILSAWCTDSMSAYSSSAAKIDPNTVYNIKITSSATTCTTSGTDAHGGADEILANLIAYNPDIEKGFAFGTKMESKAGKKIEEVNIRCYDPHGSNADTNYPNIITLEVTMADKTDTKLTFDAITSN